MERLVPKVLRRLVAGMIRVRLSYRDNDRLTELLCCVEALGDAEALVYLQATLGIGDFRTLHCADFFFGNQTTGIELRVGSVSRLVAARYRQSTADKEREDQSAWLHRASKC